MSTTKTINISVQGPEQKVIESLSIMLSSMLGSTEFPEKVKLTVDGVEVDYIKRISDEASLAVMDAVMEAADPEYNVTINATTT